MREKKPMAWKTQLYFCGGDEEEEDDDEGNDDMGSRSSNSLY